MYKSASDIRIAQLEIKLAKLESLAKEAGILQDVSDWWSGLQLESHPVMHIILNYLKRAFPNFKWEMDRTTADEYGSFTATNEDFDVIFSFNFLNFDSIYVDTFYILPKKRNIDPYYSKLIYSNKEISLAIPPHKSDIRVSGLEVAKYVEKLMNKYTTTDRRNTR